MLEGQGPPATCSNVIMREEVQGQSAGCRAASAAWLCSNTALDFVPPCLVRMLVVLWVVLKAYSLVSYVCQVTGRDRAWHHCMGAVS